jgi:hypothetical protein
MAHKAKLETHKQEEIKGIWKDKLPIRHEKPFPHT